MNNSVLEYSCKGMEAEGQHLTICRRILSAYNVLSVCLLGDTFLRKYRMQYVFGCAGHALVRDDLPAVLVAQMSNGSHCGYQTVVSIDTADSCFYNLFFQMWIQAQAFGDDRFSRYSVAFGLPFDRSLTCRGHLCLSG